MVSRLCTRAIERLRARLWRHRDEED